MTDLPKPSISPAELAEWRKACEAATPGPWTWDEKLGCLMYADGRIADLERQPDAFVAALSRTALPRLLDAYEALLARLESNVRDAWEVAAQLCQRGWTPPPIRIDGAEAVAPIVDAIHTAVEAERVRCLAVVETECERASVSRQDEPAEPETPHLGDYE